MTTFPLMYHYRIMPSARHRVDADGLGAAGHRARHKAYVESWGNSENAGAYWLGRAVADYELVLFLEYIPYVLETWLLENPSKLQQSFEDIGRTLDFLRTKGIIHFDAHFRNILTDGERIYLTDFGLVLDRNFALTKEEEEFFEQNLFYDYGEVLRNLRHLIRPLYEACSELDQRRIMTKYGIAEGLQPHERVSRLLENIEQIHADRDIRLDEFYVASIVRYRSIIALMHEFFADMWGNTRKDTKFPHAKLQLLLKGTGILAESHTPIHQISAHSVLP
jgi:serine/threonine protein kinase